MEIHQILIKYWGYSTFRPLQEDIINSVLQGRDTLALMPTGGGKSICFQVPAIALDGLCIVVTPLIALMKDQVQQLEQRGIKAVAIYSGMHPSEIDISFDNCIYGDKKFLYISPERLETELFKERLKKMKVSLLAIDEAHCISQWGYDFRPSYLKISEVRELIPSVPIIALTATATPEVVKDIENKLLFPKENLFEMSFERRNLTYKVEFTENKLDRILELLKKYSGTSIIYVRNRRKTKEIASMLLENKISAHFYHAGLTMEERDKKQSDWINNKVRTIVSTNAFGMGIDKPDVRLVIHLDVPDSLEAYFQEAGRAGRDGNNALAILLYHKLDLSNLRKNFETSFPEISYIKNVYNALGNYYQLAVGSTLESRDFVLEEFIKSYNLEPILAYNSIKFLEKEGYLFLSEAMNRFSKVMIKIDRETLYRHQVRNPKIGDFIDVLMRSYTGLFTEFSNIEEFKLAQRLETSVLAVENMLKFLDKNNILTYIPKSTKPQLSFVGGRQNEKHILIKIDTYNMLKKAAKARLDAIIEYVNSTTKCRSEMLLKYFGQNNVKRCGQCDTCISRNNVGLSEYQFNEVIAVIKPILLTKSITIETLIKMSSDIIDKEKLIIVINWLIENGKITEFGGKLIWSN